MLEIIHAGAGSGKTFTLCEIAVRHIVAGMRPERLLATTFTRRAAAELKQRIASALLSADELPSAVRLQRVDQLEGALIGTIHSVGHSLITRHAFALGLPPTLSVIDDSEATRCLHAVLGELPPTEWEQLVRLARQMEIDAPEQLLLELLAAKRENRIPGTEFRQQMRASAQRVCELCADGRPVIDGGSFQRLRELTEEAIRLLVEVVDETAITEEAKTKLRRILHHPSDSWRCFLDAAKLKAGKRSGADKLLEPLRSFARDVRCERGLHETLLQFSQSLCEQTLQLEERYSDYKRTNGQVDFTDLERLFLQLLETESEHQRLRSDIGLVLVDEFQDTSPLQLAIFTALRRISPRSHWVGDEKQAIYAFRGSDPELVRRIWNVPDAHATTGEPSDGSAASDDPAGATDSPPRVRRLQKNYRSAAGLVRVCGELFRDVLGPEAKQVPVRPTRGRVERWLIESQNRDSEMARLAGGVAELIAEGTRADEIAILARSNDRVRSIAAALDAQGIASRLEQAGLLQTREGALLLAGLRVVADRSDSLACATVCHLLTDPEESTPGWLAERLEEVHGRENPSHFDEEHSDGTRVEAEKGRPPWDGHPLLDNLRRIDHRAVSPTAVVAEVIETLHLGRHKRRWGDPSRRAAHIDAFVQLVEQYEARAVDSGEAATLPGLIHAVEDLAEAERDARQPPADADAVTLLTYHGAKGLEFETVVLFDLDREERGDPWGIAVTGGGAADAPTRDRTLRYWPWPFGRNPHNGALLIGTGVEISARQSEEGQAALKTAREESMRLLYVGFTRARDRLVLAHRADQYSWLARLPHVDRLFPCEPDATPPGADKFRYDYVVRRFTADAAPAVADSSPTSWFNPDGPARKKRHWRERIPQWHSPSRQPPCAANLQICIEETGSSPFFPAAKTEEEFQQIGDGVHAYLAALPSLLHCDSGLRSECAHRCLAGHQSLTWLTPEWLVDAGEAFQHWVERRWPDSTWTCEVPFLAARPAGGSWRGRADLVIWVDDTTVVLVDHKSTPMRTQRCEAEAAAHSGQISASIEALSQLGLHVNAAFIHFPLAARVAQVSPDGP